MKKLLATLAVVLCLSLVGLAQADQNAAKSKAGAQAKPEGKSSQLTGCISGPNAEGVYVLTNGRYKKGVEVGGSDELKNHVGHQVKLTGTWSAPKAIGETEQAGKAEGKESAGRHFKVDSITHASDTCPPAGATKSGKAGKKAGFAPKQ